MNNTLLSGRVRRASLLAGLSVITGIAPGYSVLAQNQDTDNGALALEEIVVTAQKRAQSLQDVPVTMQAYSGDKLKKMGVNQLTDITRLAPNLNVVVQNALSQHIIIRGVGTNEFFGNAPSSVGLYMDEVTLNSSYLSTLGLFDMERVEILRGPQNSLFGRNTTGGAVNYISRMPEVGGDVEGFGELTYGKHNLVEVESGVSVPMGEHTAMRVAGMYHSRDGIWNNLDSGDDSYGDTERYSLRGTLVTKLSDATTVTVSLHHARDRSEAQPQKVAGALTRDTILRINDLAPFTEDIDFRTRLDTVNIEGINHSTRNWHDVWTGGSQRADLDVDGGYLKLQHDFETVSLTSITSYDHTHAYYEEDNTANGNTNGVNHDVLIIDMDQEYEQYSQELRLASADDTARFRWIAGLFYLKENSLLAQNIRFGSNGFPGAHPSAVGITPPELFDIIPNPYPNTVSFSIADLSDESYSAYLHTDYDLAEKWALTVGVRYTHDNKGNPSYYAGAFDKTGTDPSIYYDRATVETIAAALPACPDISAGALPFSHCANENTSRENLKSNKVGGKINLQYRPNDDFMIYGGYSRGFKSGKFDVEFLHTDATPFPQRPLTEEILDSFEIGFKSTLADNSLQLNGAIFYNFWKNQQVFNVGVHGPEFFNLPKSEIKGLELEANWLPAQNWLISTSLGMLDSELTDVTGIDFDLGEGDFQKGHELPLTPKFTWNGTILHDIAIGENMLTVQANARYQSKSKVKFSPQIPIDEYDSRFEVNARIGYNFGAGQQYQLSAYVDNIFAEKYCVEKQDLRGVSGSFYCVPNEGEAQWGMTLRVNF